MRIGIVSSEYPPFHGGGIGTYSATLSRALARAGHDVHVIANCWHDFFPGESPGTSGPLGAGRLTVHRLDAISTEYGPRPPHQEDCDPLGQVCRYWESSLYWSMHAAEALSDLHRRLPLDIVEFPECFAEGYVAMRRRKLGDSSLDFPMTVTLHSPIYEVARYNRDRMQQAYFQRRKMMEEYCLSHADTLSSPSQHLVDTLRSRLGPTFDGVPCRVIHNPMEFDTWDSSEQRDQPTGAPPTLLFVGRLEPRKGVQFLVEAAVRLMAVHPSLRVVLIGRDREAGDVPGSMKEQLLRRIPAELRTQFVFEGIRPRQQVLTRYVESTACVFPVPWDNFPYTCCEAMAAGACVVASSNSGMAEMIQDGQSGILFSAGDAGALSSAIQRVLADPDLRQRLRRNAPGRIRELCDPVRVTDQRIAHYEQTIRHFQRSRQARSSPGTQRPGELRLAVFVAEGDSQLAREKTIRSIQNAARDNVQLDVFPSPNRLAAGSRVEDAGESADLRRWLESMNEQPPDYLMQLHAGESLEKTYFSKILPVFGQQQNVAWATSWAFSTEKKHHRSYAGFDFSVPLELLYYHPVPFAVIAYRPFMQVGGLNLQLPSGWREWDLWLAFQQAGFSGLVVPEWLAHYSPHAGSNLKIPSHEKAHELILESIAERSGALLAEHAVAMWMNMAANPRQASPAANLCGNGHNSDNTESTQHASTSKAVGQPQAWSERSRRGLLGKALRWLSQQR